MNLGSDNRAHARPTKRSNAWLVPQTRSLSSRWYISGETCHDDVAKAEALRYHLAAIAQESIPEDADGEEQLQRSAQTVHAERSSADAGPPALASPWAVAEVVAGLRVMANNKAPGEDGMPAELLEKQR